MKEQYNEYIIQYQSFLTTTAGICVTLAALFALYALSSWLLGRIFHKAKVSRTWAWIPVAREYKLLQIGGRSGSYAFTQIVENLHKFTLSYPATIVLFHQDHLIISHAGQVITQPYTKATDLWTGKLPTRIATYQIWSENPLETTAAAIT